jgi:Flp pilus assembly protein TadD/predicted aspartyl protease
LAPRGASALFTALAVVAVAIGLAAFSPAPDPDVQLQMGRFLYSQGLYSDALAAYQAALKSEDPATQTAARKGVVQSALRVASFALARNEALTLRQGHPGDSEALSLFGDAMWASGLFDDAEASYRDALALAPKDARALNGLAKVHSARGQQPQAMEHGMAAIGINPRDAEFHHTVGNIYERLGRYDLAAESLVRFINLLPVGARDERGLIARAELRFLLSFGRKQPSEILGNPNQVHVVPFRLEDDKVLIRGKVNGGREMDFVVDTGAEMAALTRTAAERDGVTPVTYTISAGVGDVGLRGLQLGRMDRFEIGGLRVRNVPAIIKNPGLTGMPREEPETFSPLALGLSMSVDYQRRLLTMARRLPEEDRADVRMPMWMNRLATVRGLVDGNHSASFVVDTGGQVISISTSTATALNRPPVGRRIGLRVWGASGWDPEAYLLPGVQLAFSDIRYRDFSVVVLNLRAPSVLLGYELGGIVGHQFLSRYRVSFDLERSVLRLNRNVS